MTAITAGLVRELREATGAGMMDCKKALTENNGDIEAATDWLRVKGLSKAAKKSDRAAVEGLVAVKTDGTKGAVLEVNSETDFVARNESFQEFVTTLAGLTLETGADAEALAEQQYPGAGRSVADELTDKIATIGENMGIRRSQVMSVDQGVVVSYMHNPVVEGLGKIGVLVALESGADTDALTTLGKQLCMHVAAADPVPAAISEADLDPALIEKERTILVDQARESGRPEEIIAKMVDGRLAKFKKELCLLDQVFVVDGESKISDVLAKASKDLGSDVTLKAFARFQLGEGMEKKEDDFAAEVAAMAG